MATEQWTHEIFHSNGNVTRIGEAYTAMMDSSGVWFWSGRRTTMRYFPWSNVIEYKKVKVIR